MERGHPLLIPSVQVGVLVHQHLDHLQVADEAAFMKTSSTRIADGVDVDVGAQQELEHFVLSGDAFNEDGRVVRQVFGVDVGVLGHEVLEDRQVAVAGREVERGGVVVRPALDVGAVGETGFHF